MVIIQESSTKYKTFALTNLSYKSLYNLFLSSDYAVSTQPSLLGLTCNNYYYQAFPPSSSPFLLSRRSPLSVLPIRAVDPFLRRGEACDGCCSARDWDDKDYLRIIPRVVW